MRAMSKDGTKLTHFSDDGRAQMVDVSAKAETDRMAVATGIISLEPTTITLIQAREIGKGDVLAVAELAGIMAVKKTADMIPLCHPLPVTHATLTFDIQQTDIQVQATVKTTGKTGVEMEALTAVSIACLTIYDMVKAVDRQAVIGEIKLRKKSGGASGEYEA